VQGLADLEDAVRKAEPAALQHLLKLFSDANIDRRKPAGRAALMRFISLIATKHVPNCCCLFLF
jgi:citrate lyase beta subunit